MQIFHDKILEDLTCELETRLQEQRVEVMNIKKIPYGVQLFLEDYNGEVIIVNIYNGKGGLKFVFNNKNSPIYQIIMDCIEEKKICPDIPYDIYMGTDESGKGDYFGPLVICGFVAERKTYKELRQIGVKDSKALNEDKLFDIADHLYHKYSECIHIYSMIPEKYNELYSHMKLQRKNLNDLLARGHAKIIEEMAEGRPDVQGVVADQFGNPRYIHNALMEKGKQLEVLQITRAEKDMAVAAASILARFHYIKWLEDASRQYKIIFPKGSGAEAVNAALEIIKTNGIKVLSKVAKIHFKTTQQILDLYHNRNDTTADIDKEVNHGYRTGFEL